MYVLLTGQTTVIDNNIRHTVLQHIPLRKHTLNAGAIKCSCNLMVYVSFNDSCSRIWIII